MKIDQIKERLESEFFGLGRRLIFWYDPQGEFAEEVENLNLACARVIRLTGSNYLKTKYAVERAEPQASFLIYAPFARPEDKENHLADMVHYSSEFHADRFAMICADLGMPGACRGHLANYPRFWRSAERVSRFSALGIADYTDDSIDTGMLAVAAGVKAASFYEVVRAVLLDGGIEDNQLLTRFDKQGLLQVFWQMCGKHLGYTDERATAERLALTLLITHTAHSFQGDSPKAWQAYVSPKRNDVAVFVSNLANNMLYRDQYDKLAEAVASRLKLGQTLKALSVDSYQECDTFEDYDHGIIKHLSDTLAANSEPLSERYRRLAEARSSKKHFAPRFAACYKALLSADKMFAALGLFAPGSARNAAEAVVLYTKEWWKLDLHYRSFYSAYDRSENRDHLAKLREAMENAYANRYLAKLSVAWSEKLAAMDSLADLPGPAQRSFYRRVAGPASRRECTVVVISDGLRYECAAELSTRFEEKANASAELGHMIAVVPSQTRLAMAALLPHSALTLNATYDVAVDGMPVVSLEQRNAVLIKHNPQALAVNYSSVMGMSREAIRDLLTGKELIYVYHNQIDARGDNAATEDEVLQAVAEAQREIEALVQKLTVDKSITSYIVTADHGFIYKRGRLDESDKVVLQRPANSLVNKRYILSPDPVSMEGSLCFALDDSGYVTVPRGVNIFKTPGGGQNYVHGGAALQEIVVPVLRIKTERYRRDVGQVEVALTSLTRRITSLLANLDFIQQDNVTDVLKPAKVKTYFATDGGEVVSSVELIIADKRNLTPDKRTFREKYTFRNRPYSSKEKYYLVIEDAESGVELARHEFSIDIAFTDDFGSI